MVFTRHRKLEARINGPDRALGLPSVCDRDHRLTHTPCPHSQVTIWAKIRSEHTAGLRH